VVVVRRAERFWAHFERVMDKKGGSFSGVMVTLDECGGEVAYHRCIAGNAVASGSRRCVDLNMVIRG
jgi:hypothetical protein